MDNDRIRLQINGKGYEVEIGEITPTPFEVVVNGTSYLVQVESSSAASSLEQMPPAATRSNLSIAQAAKNRATSPSISPPAGSTGGKEIRAPMPGVILDIRVKAGMEVKIGQVLCFLEAMKMKNAIRSPHDGRVAAVEVVDGQKVAYNDLLIRFE